MHEALETWPVEMMGRILPRHLQIIYDINAQFLHQISLRGGSPELLREVSLVDEAGERRVRMAYLAVVASHSVNGVSALHSELDEGKHLLRLCQSLARALQQQNQRHHPAPLAGAGQPGLVGRAGQAGRHRLAPRPDPAQRPECGADQPKVDRGLPGAKLANKQRLAAGCRPTWA